MSSRTLGENAMSSLKGFRMFAFCRFYFLIHKGGDGTRVVGGGGSLLLPWRRTFRTRIMQ